MPLIAAAIGVVGSVAVPLVQKKIAEKKAKKAAKKAKAEEARLEKKAKEDEEATNAARGLVGHGSPVSGSLQVGGMNVMPFVLGGAAILAAFFLLKKGR